MQKHPPKKLLAFSLAALLTLAGCTPGSVGTSPTDAQTGDEADMLQAVIADAPNSVDFSVRDGVPLFKKYSYFIIGDTDFGNVNKYASELLNLRARQTRFSLTVQATEDEPLLVKKHMKSAMDLFGNAIHKNSSCFWHMSYVRSAINSTVAAVDSANAIYYEPVYSIWNNAWKAAAEYFREKNIRSTYEVWNEPDQPNATKFNWDAYIRMYQNTAAAVRAGDPDAVIGGISASHLSVLGKDNYIKFLDTIRESETPIDFVSFHDYDRDYLTEVPQIRAELLARDDYYNKTSIMYTEFNIHNLPMSEWSTPIEERSDFYLQKSEAVPEMIRAIDNLNSMTDVSLVQWAALLMGNSCFAIIDSEGNRAPAYWAQYLYAHMPVERVLSENAQDGVIVLASSDEGKSAIMICNSNTADVQYSLNLQGIPYAQYDAAVYRIDKQHTSYLESDDHSDELVATALQYGLTADAMGWSGTIPAGGTVYIELTSGEECPLETWSEVGFIVRTDWFYKNRTQNAYGDFDDLTATALVGTGDQADGRGIVAVTLRDVQDSIHVTGKVSGDFSFETADSFAGVRIDYQTDSGYTYSVAYTHPNASKERTSQVPFGTEQAPDKIITVDLTNFDIAVKENAPADWNGQVVITFDVENTGSNTEYKWTMN